LKEKKDQGINGQIGMNLGLGTLGIKKENLPNIRPQYQHTPKINPSLSANYRKKNYNLFIQADHLYTETLNKNEFVTRTYQNGTQIIQQLKRNRDTHYWTSNAGMDWFLNDYNQLTISGLFTQESIKDYGDQPFFNSLDTDQIRLWQFIEDEVLTAAMGSITYQHSYRQPGHQLSAGIHYTFDREDEKYFFTNTLPLYTTKESFFLIADQKVIDINLDYTKPLNHGLLEIGTKFRKRIIPTDMQFNPSTTNSILDVGADGLATYQEIIPAIYGNYTYEVKKLEMEIGLRIEYVDLKYEVDPNHNTYQSDGYQYFQPFPNARITYKINSNNKLSAFYNRRVDRPDEVDIRIFPKYDDAEIIKVGNPALQPQFTNSFELGYKNIGANGSFYTAIYHSISNGTITRMATSIEPSNLIYNISQNAGKSSNTGLEMVFQRDFSNKFQVNLNLNGYLNRIDPFTVVNLYPISHIFQGASQKMYSGSIQLNANLKIGQDFEGQMTVLYLAPDILPQGRINARYSINMGFKKLVQNGRGALLLNIQDLLNTMVTSKAIQGNNFSYASTDYYETQVIRVGYQYKI
jgi:outer membrane receptor protein involved in Fe transport